MNLKPIILISLAMLFVISGSVVATRGGGGGGRGDGPVVYVESQGLAYDSIIAADPLPWKPQNSHTFQQLFPGQGPTGLSTQYGPGDPEYRGGRWWVDANGNGHMDMYDVYFSCPLLGPGMIVPE
jgi:hypothetical protein